MASVFALASALVRTFLVIGIGSAAALSGYLDRAAAAGIGQLVAKVCLPALLFKATATADLSSLRLEVVIAVLVAKWTAFVVAALVGWPDERHVVGTFLRARCDGLRRRLDVLRAVWASRDAEATLGRALGGRNAKMPRALRAAHHRVRARIVCRAGLRDPSLHPWREPPHGGRATQHVLRQRSASDRGGDFSSVAATK